MGPDFSECPINGIINSVKNTSDINKVIKSFIEITDNENSLNTSEEIKHIMRLVEILYSLIDINHEELEYENALNLTTNFINLFNNLINQKNSWNYMTNSEMNEIASQILLYIQFTSFILSCNQYNSHTNVISNENIIVETYNIDFSEDIIFDANGSYITIPKNFNNISNTICNNSAVAALINKLYSFLLNGLQDEQQINTNIIAFSATNSNESIELSDGLKASIK